MAFSSLISAIDPVSALAIFGSMNIEPMLHMLVFGESVVNDAVAIALFRSFASGFWEEFGFGTVILSLLRFLGILIGSFVFGVFVALLASLTLKHCRFMHKELETATVFLYSYAAFLFTEAIGLSGIVASLFCGITLNYYGGKNMTEERKVYCKSVLHMVAHVAEILIFMQVGMDVFLYDNNGHYPIGFALFTLFICSLLRAVMVYGLTFVINRVRKDKNKIPGKYQIVMWHAGLRGAIAYALAVSFPSQNRQAIVCVTMFIILFTVIVQGCTLYDLLKWLGIQSGAALDKSIIDKVKNREVTEEELVDAPSWHRKIAQFNRFYMIPFFGGQTSDVSVMSTGHGKNVSDSTDLQFAYGNGDSENFQNDAGETKEKIIDVSGVAYPAVINMQDVEIEGLSSPNGTDL